MKKILSLIFVTVLCFALSCTVLAEGYTVGSDGNAVYETAVGYVFDIEDINGSIGGEDATILTSADGLANCGTWAIWFAAEEIGDTGVYKAITDGAAMNGTAPSVDLKDNQIIVVVHSASSNPNDAGSYPNWEDKVACLAVKTGDCLVFDGINIDAGVCQNGTMTVVTQEDVDNGNIPETSVPATESSEAEESVEESVAESTEPAESSEEASADAVSSVSEEESDPDINSSTMATEEDGLGVWLYVIIGAAVIAVIAVVVLVAKKK